MGYFARVETRVRARRNSSESMGGAGQGAARESGGILPRGRRFERAKDHWALLYISRTRETVADRSPRHAIQCPLSLGDPARTRNRDRRRSWASSHSNALLLARSGT